MDALSIELSFSLAEAQLMVEDSRSDHSTRRPYSALGVCACSAAVEDGRHGLLASTATCRSG
jgi:hypothetical protein